MSPRVRRRTVAIVVAVVLAAAVPAGVAFALWGDSAAQAGGVVVNGNLDLAPDATTGSAVSWVETTPTIPVGERASGTDFASLAQFRGTPGDSVDVRYAVSTTLAGDNISAVLRAQLGTPAPALPSGVQIAGYRVLNAAGALLAPATGFTALGTETVLPALTSAGAQRYLIALRIQWTGTASALTYTTNLTGADPPTLTTIPVEIRLEQVRTGAGFQP